MKKNRDEEKITAPLFPRLHLNDTEKGGPRAPPRNKMALYEQLSIPSQRFKPGAVAKNSINIASTIPSTSSEGSSQQKGELSLFQPPASRQPAEQPYSHFSDSNVRLEQPQLEKKSEEDDFMVPVFMQTNVREDFKRHRSNNTGEKLIHSSQAYTQDSTVHVPTGGNETIRRSVVLPTKTQERKSINIAENMEEVVINNQKSIDIISNSTGLLGCQSDDAYACGEPGDNPLKNSSALPKAGLSLPLQKKVEIHSTSRVNVSAGSTNNGNTLVLKQDHPSDGRKNIDDDESRDDGMCGSLQLESADAGDHTSETSMVDCVPGLAISPDDVVGIIGQKHFWKARRAIVNQQRVFAVQVFELHRLIKVQKLMAGSPNLLHDSLLLGKSIKIPSTMKLPVDHLVKRPLDASTLKNGAEKPNHRMEGSAENNVGKESLSSELNACQQQLSSKPVSVNSPMTVIPSDNTLGPWCFNQPQGQQWLIPVMSPTEGLVYKPYYPGSGLMPPFFGGSGLPGVPPMVGSFVSHPAYGAAGMAIPPFSFHAGSHGFFPPYGNAPVMNHSITDSAADQTNHPVLSPQLEPQTCKSSSRKDEVHGVVPGFENLHESRDGDVQASTSSNPRRQGTGRRNNSSGGSNVLALLPTFPVMDTPSCNTRSPQVIKVVPHGGISATESAARIFQSIQQERKHHNS